jgi:Ca2+-binding EF-hand superfamily protein
MYSIQVLDIDLEQYSSYYKKYYSYYERGILINDLLTKLAEKLGNSFPGNNIEEMLNSFFSKVIYKDINNHNFLFFIEPKLQPTLLNEILSFKGSRKDIDVLVITNQNLEDNYVIVRDLILV